MSLQVTSELVRLAKTMVILVLFTLSSAIATGAPNLELKDAQQTWQRIDAAIPLGDAAADQALRAESNEIGQQLRAISAETVLDAYQVEQIRLRIGRLGNFVTARNARPDSPFGLATADSMALVYPRKLPCPCDTAVPNISLAKGEYESMQAVVLAYGEDLLNVEAKIVNVVGPDGAPASEKELRASVAPLGSVLIGQSGFYSLPATAYRPANYIGWIPDPIRTDIASVNVSATDMQPYWVEVYATDQAQSGTYHVTISFSVSGVTPQTLEVAVDVWPFTIPDRPVLATSMTTNPVVLNNVYNITDPVEHERMWNKYLDFLETFKIEPDLIYRRTPPTVEELMNIKTRWGLRQFNLYYIYPVERFDLGNPASWQEEIDKILCEVGEAMAKYEEAGLAEYAYIYGFDESRSEYYPLAKAVLRQIKERFPDLRVMTTLLDRSLGVSSGLVGLIDVWVPGVQAFDHNMRAIAQELGDEVYWYTHVSVRDPYPNWFNGYAPSDTRVLLGPLSHRTNVDGFLYYNITRWPSRGPMRDGIFSLWDARTYFDAYGDGSLFYPGAEGPLASQRIQNFRDGLEDYNLLVELEKRIVQAQNVSEDLLAKAGYLLAADAVAVDERNYTKDPEIYRQWRDDVAEMIVQLDQAGQSSPQTVPANPSNERPLASAQHPTLAEAREAAFQRAWIAYPHWFTSESGPFPVKVHIDSGLDLKSFSISVDGEVFYEGHKRPDGPVATLDLPDGLHQISLQVTDVDGNVWEDKIGVTVKTAEIVQLQPNDRVRGTVPIAVSTIFDQNDLVEVTISVTPIRGGEPDAKAGLAVYQGRSLPERLDIDTLMFPDGPYDLQYRATVNNGRESAANARMLIDNWDVASDEFQLPTSTGWFGFVDRKKTIAESDGWDYADGDKPGFFADGNRRIWSGAGAGHLTWQAQNLKRFAVTLYAKEFAPADLDVSISDDQENWQSVLFSAVQEGVSSAGWTKWVLTGQIDEVTTGYIRVTLGDRMGREKVQLGQVDLMSPVSE